ncbi:ATP-binding cassette domain-containing protein [Actinomadura parmotrematis]|uniref:ATP-binding cassette domain-containing protein n=1 Tax=Actinomadura parmotrematis TaxID=2864039 RepID=A0ABS7G4T2_9ACTN|nr:ATP-binding cassette domain-containing protein [Actinomadura parmotrematis]MBW8487728.1 ATP-binding cassette domain-containing protein [Actinomadura parmotrematis]
MITLRDLTKRYGDRVAVDGLSLDLRPGQVTGFLGPNGAGKSTTMRMILGLDRPTRGQALIDGRPYAALDRPLRCVGALLDARAVHPGRSARAHLRAMAASNAVPARRVDQVLEEVGLGAVARRRAGSFSLGMSQRLGIAGALLGEPGVLLFDEPVNGLDPDGVLWVRRLMRSLAADGATVLVSSHLMSEMQLTADRLVVIGRGRLLADAPVADLIAAAAPSTVRARGIGLDRLRRALDAEPGPVRVDLPGPAASFTGHGGAGGGGDEVVVTGVAIERLGELAHRAGVVLHELSPRRASLEEAYMELTGASVEYGSGPAGPAEPAGRAGLGERSGA